ncbi:hypothetical protein PsYK624_078330 [Phanerochaete sordida]|uniref:LysM domain-containing protein n=1 Tax=Phanerochaete sordida TaxID=48140 RepID=A0A9P3G963_9APHY|nr:hypothetical protein PsYK624_078330 [Phanerochaete sordida]
MMLAIALLAVLAAVHAVSAATHDLPVLCERSYIVNPRDSCERIEIEEKVSTYQLFRVNPQIDPACENLAVAETLCLGIQGQDCSSVYRVQSGDTCRSIAANAGISQTVLMLNNRNVNQDCTNLVVGEVLCVSPAIIIYT